MRDNLSYKKTRVVSISLVIFCQSFQALAIGGIALFFPLIRQDLELSFTQGGVISGATILVYALMQIPIGYLADRFGSKRLFFIGIIGTTTLSFTLGLVQEYWQIIANQTLSGFFRAFLFAPTLVLLTGWFPPQRRATATALYFTGILLGNLVLDIVGPLIVMEFSWRYPFIIFSSAGIMASFFFLRFAKEPPRIEEKQKVTVSEILHLFRYRFMWVCGLLQYIRLAIMQGILVWLPSFLIDEKALSLQATGLLIAVYSGLIAPAGILGGYVSDRLKNHTTVIGFSLVILAITTWLFTTVNSIPMLIAIIGINGVFVQMYFGPLFSLPVEVLGARTAGISSGFSNFFANIGAFTFVYLMGRLKDTTGSFESGFYAISVICVIGIVLTVILARMKGKISAIPNLGTADSQQL